MDSLRQFMLRWVDYDEWANSQWLAYLERFTDRAQAERVYRHLLGCYCGWMPLISQWNDKPDEALDLKDDAAAIYVTLRECLIDGDLDEVVQFQGRSSMRQLRRVELVHHMLNHASYHRGHLRTLAEAEGSTDFPDTDSVFWFVENPRP